MELYSRKGVGEVLYGEGDVRSAHNSRQILEVKLKVKLKLAILSFT